MWQGKVPTVQGGAPDPTAGRKQGTAVMLFLSVVMRGYAWVLHVRSGEQRKGAGIRSNTHKHDVTPATPQVRQRQHDDQGTITRPQPILLAGATAARASSVKGTLHSHYD